MVGGVNNARNYIELMGFGYVDPATGDPVGQTAPSKAVSYLYITLEHFLDA